MKTKKMKYKPKKTPFILLFVTIVLFITSNIFHNKSKEGIEEQPRDYSMKDVHSVDYPESPYTTSLFIWENGVIVYEDENYYSKCGIDISEHQGNIDFNKAKADGIEFAYLRLGYRGYQSGELNQDSRFEEYYAQAKESGMEIGVYFFSSAITIEEAMDEAYFVIEHLQNKEIDYEIAFDYEDIDYASSRYDGLTNEEKTDIALAFCQIIKENGYTPIIYANSYWFNDIYDLSKIYNYDVWVAQYGSSIDFAYDFKIWQYTQIGRVDGIEPKVDINVKLFKK